MKYATPVKIIAALRLSHASWRDFLRGFLNAIQYYPHWSMKIADPSDIGDAIGETPPDGIVIGDIGELAATALLKTKIPTVVVGSQSTDISRRRSNIAFLHNDDEDIGREGAKIALTLGNRNGYGFVQNLETTHWSNLRAKGFAEVMQSAGKTASVFRTLPASPYDIGNRLLRWLQALPKPAAVMSACDATAMRVLELCRSAGIDVPSQIAVIGVDNDRLLCEMARPSLSSIAPDHFHEGELAADVLAGLIGRKTSRPKNILCTSKKFISRESTRHAKPATVLMRRALAFIEENAASKITASDVARNLGVSRQLVELRFREFGEKTLAGTIRETRLKEVRRQLRATRQTIRAIAANCGWANVNHLENAFRRRFGTSMREWRKQ